MVEEAALRFKTLKDTPNRRKSKTLGLRRIAKTGGNQRTRESFRKQPGKVTRDSEGNDRNSHGLRTRKCGGQRPVGQHSIVDENILWE